MRLFFALLPNANTRDQLSMAVGGLTLPCGARLLAPENYHVTLAFIGEVRDSDLPRYREMGANLGVPRCATELAACEYWASSQALVLAARVNPTGLVLAAHRLRESIADYGASRDKEKNWRAHVTLARKVAQAPVLAEMSAIPWVSRSFALMRSLTGGGHAVYTVVDSWSLLDKS